MRLKVRNIRGVALIEIDGKLIGGPGDSEKLADAVESLLGEGKSRIAVDLRRVPWASSQGLGLLIAARARVGRVGGEIVLVNVEDRIKELLTVTKLCVLFRCCSELDEAVSYLGGQPGGAPTAINDQPAY